MMGNALARILRSAPQLQMTLSKHAGLQGTAFGVKVLQEWLWEVEREPRS